MTVLLISDINRGRFNSPQISVVHQLSCHFIFTTRNLHKLKKFCWLTFNMSTSVSLMTGKEVQSCRLKMRRSPQMENEDTTMFLCLFFLWADSWSCLFAGFLLSCWSCQQHHRLFYTPTWHISECQESERHSWHLLLITGSVLLKARLSDTEHSYDFH